MPDEFQCIDHDVQKQIHHSGYSLAHNSEVKASPRDLEGIDFTFDIEEYPDENGHGLSLSLTDADGARDYLSKFANWEEQVTKAAENDTEQGCPECTSVMWWPHQKIETSDDDTQSSSEGQVLEVESVDEFMDRIDINETSGDEIEKKAVEDILQETEDDYEY